MDADLRARLRAAVSAVEAKKGYHILALDVSERTSIADVFLICSVGSQRQAQAVADEVDRALTARGARPLAVEGYSQAGWILMDFGDFVFHIFLEERREFFALERLWGDAPEVTAGLRDGAR
ncbi:MAG TPA: ribosome silencing factor [Thermoanaerobaculaceae bacterium]|nr:ribosome silencing factor [Thermoanaerobaculaceae bacterium]